MSEADLSGLKIKAKPYLSELIDVSQFKRGQANIIISSCHSGKTTAAIKIMDSCATRRERTLFLIDTTAGRDSISKTREAQRYLTSWAYELRQELTDPIFFDEGYRVMTYHQFGWEIIKHPDILFNIDLIICDEMHNLLKYMGIEHSKNEQGKNGEIVTCCATAFNTLMNVARAKAQAPMLIIMTATANQLSYKLEEYQIPYEHFNYTDEAHSDKTKERRYYANLENVLMGLNQDERAIVYIPTIGMMLEYAGKIPNNRKTCCLWGINNDDHQLSAEQLEVRDAILNNKRIPADIDILFINAAYETCINIENEDFNTMIVHCGNADTQTQVRGRLRHDIDVLYLYDKNHEYISRYLPEHFYDRQLFRQDTAEIVDLLNLKDENGRQRKWPSIRKALEKDGVTVQAIKKNDKRGYILHKAS